MNHFSPAAAALAKRANPPHLLRVYAPLGADVTGVERVGQHERRSMSPNAAGSLSISRTPPYPALNELTVTRRQRGFSMPSFAGLCPRLVEDALEHLWILEALGVGAESPRSTTVTSTPGHWPS